MPKIDWIKVCQEMGRRAGEKILEIYATEQRNTELGTGYGGDTTLKADKAAEDIIIRKLRKLDTWMKIISEEAGEISIGKIPEYTLVVDPLDGSFNYKIGVGYFGVSIGVLDKNKDVIAGYVLNVPGGTEFYATEEGAFKNGARIRTGKRNSRGHMLLECSNKADSRAIAFLSNMLLKVRHVRAYGAVALDLCNVADGSFDCFLYAGVSRYLDVAAGIYILEKAGGIVSDFQGDKKIREGTRLRVKNLLAVTNRHIYDMVLRNGF